ncbi:helix-turn-helix protein [Acinetobacter calcoaceticus]|uniref:Helix-turn-helix protein n=1 Tax=Acinetobacter calcoaceticus TaxID=471 RepID=A0A4R1XCG9_ACICA|nr:helix-turn-helix protein [Acinetobacter calcoaceticus]
MSQAYLPELSGRQFQNVPIFTPQNLIFACQDVQETCKGVGQIFKPHRLTILKQKADFSASMHHFKTKANLSISRLDYSQEVLIEPDFLEQFYLIQIPTQGYAEIEFDRHKFISYVQVASIISPEQSFKMRCHAGTPQLMLKISKDDFIQHCRQHIPEFHLKAPRFDPKLDFSTQHGHYFLQLFRTLVDALSCEQHPLQHPLAFKQFESNLFNALIYGQPNNALQTLQHSKAQVVSPFFIKRTEAYIREHLHEALNVEKMAEHAGVSVRTLFNGFKNFLDTTPMAYLKELRFEQAHLELQQNELVSITDVAYKWGFCHLGRFSQEYKQRYGELPSSTRRFNQNEIKVV